MKKQAFLILAVGSRKLMECTCMYMHVHEEAHACTLVLLLDLQKRLVVNHTEGR